MFCSGSSCALYNGLSHWSWSNSIITGSSHVLLGMYASFQNIGSYKLQIEGTDQNEELKCFLPFVMYSVL